LFVSAEDPNKWVLWTPSGYYDASPSGEELVGWHVNNGPEQAADFFPIYQFKGQFYRPDVIDHILETADESLAVRMADQKAGRRTATLTVASILPPVVTIDSPKVKEIQDSTVSLTYNIRNHSNEPVTDVKVLVEGREVQVKNVKSPNSSSGLANISFQAPRRDAELTIIAENRFTKSLPATIQLKWKGKT
jgi:hypothetical protein